MKKWLQKAKKSAGYIIEFFKLISKYDKIYIFILCIETLVTALQAFPSMFLLKASADALSNMIEFRKYIRIVILLLLIIFIKDLIWNYVNTASPARRNRVMIKMRNDFSKKCLELDYELLSSPEILDKKELASNAIYQGMGSATWGFLIMVGNILTSIGSVAIIITIEPISVLLVIMTVFLNTRIQAKSSKRQYELSVDKSQHERKFNYLISTFSGFENMKEILVYNMQDKIIARSKKIVGELLDITKKQQKVNLSYSVVTVILVNIINVCIYAILGFKVFSGKISLGDFLLCFQGIMIFKGKLGGISGWFDTFIRSSGYMVDYFEFMGIKSKLREGNLKINNVEKPEISFHSVSFKYPGQERYSLRNINFTLKAGEKLAIVGENGAGKTTLIKLLLRLYSPTEGFITYNDIDIKDIDYDNYMDLFSALFQDFKLFAIPISKNIDSLAPENNPARIEKVAKLSGIHEKIEGLKFKYDTTLYRTFDDDGVELSGGEQQKLSLARSLYKDTKIIIMDEPTAALDPRAEYNFYKLFSGLTKDKTAIFISHRLTSTRFCDNIIVLDKGELVEYGSHEELNEKNGLYSELYNLQSQLYQESSCS